VVKECRLEGHIANRRSAKSVTVIGVTGDLLKAKVFVLARAIEGHIACERRDLWNPDDVLIKVAEHLVGGARNLVTIDAPGFAKEKQRTLLFVVTQCSNLASRKLVNGGIGKDQGEFEFSDSEPEHIEGNRAAGPHRGEDLAESLSVFSYAVDS